MGELLFSSEQTVFRVCAFSSYDKDSSSPDAWLLVFVGTIVTFSHTSPSLFSDPYSSLGTDLSGAKCLEGDMLFPSLWKGSHLSSPHNDLFKDTSMDNDETAKILTV